MDKQCCGTCNSCEYSRETREWLCVNVDSDNYGMDTAYNDVCEEWSARK